MIDRASAQVRNWSYGNLSKRDALRFSRSVMKYGNESQIDLIVAEVGGALGAASLEAQCELFNALIDGCTEAAELGNLDSKFCILSYLKPSNWSKGCGWNQIDDARLLLRIHFHGFGNWEKIRLDERLGLNKKIAPAEL
ncbi:hypothetical protein AAHE18_16G140500 [Arachis hypogaea]